MSTIAQKNWRNEWMNEWINNKQTWEVGSWQPKVKHRIEYLSVMLKADWYLEPRWQLGCQSPWQKKKKRRWEELVWEEGHSAQILICWILSYLVVITLNGLGQKKKFPSEKVLKLKFWLNWVHFISFSSFDFEIQFKRPPMEKEATSPSSRDGSSSTLHFPWIRSSQLIGNSTEAQSESCSDQWLAPCQLWSYS